MKKRTFPLLLGLALCLTAIPAAAASAGVTVVMKLGCSQMAVNDAVLAVDDQNAAVCPIAESGRTLVPVSRIVEAFGGKSTWDPATNATTFTLKGRTVSHVIGANTVTTPTGTKTMEVPSKAINNRTYVPVRYILEGLDLNVEYEPTQQLVVISTHALDANNLLALPQAKTLLGALGQSGGDPVSQGEVLVSAAAPVAGASISKDSVSVQDPHDYMPKSMTFDNIDENENGQQYRKFRGGKDSYDLVKDYVDALCATGNFTRKDSYYEEFPSAAFFDFALTYTGAGRVSGDKPEMTFKEGVTGDVTIYGATERSSCEGYIYIVKGLEFDDLGLRSTGETASTDLPGQSLGTDLYRLSDGSYRTGDGRFHVEVGNAQVYRDGTACTVPATLRRNQDKNREELRIDNFCRSDSIIFTAPYNSLLTGDTFDTRTIGLNESVGYEDFATSMDSFLDWTFSNKLVGVCHDGDYLYCYRDGGNDFEEVSVRVMYWDAARGEAVIYLCATFDSAPYEYEALAAVKMETAQAQPSGGGSGSGDKDCWYCGGSGTCPTCHGRGTVNKWMPGTTHTYVEVNCTDCHSPGKCRVCGGDGRG